ncbi:uncharacterized protein LOC104001782 isoform X4 [Pan troglodytes]|uniref:uncharacterized protein LOC104001782 isoform X4 n=1 Tax=Pan troglodytes TaxID=9598 RepID=UPI003013AF96
MFGCVRRFFLLVGSWFRWLRSEAADLRDSLQQYHHLKPKVEMKKCVSNQAVGMKDVQACTSAFSALDFNSLTFSNELHERSENLKVGDLCPFVSPPMTNTVLGSTDLGKMNLIDQEKMTTAAAFLFWNHTLRDLCESQLPENKDSKKDGKCKVIRSIG